MEYYYSLIKAIDTAMVKKLTKWAKQNRKQRTRAELLFFKMLQRTRPHIRFRSQRPFDKYIVDFVIPTKQIVIEIDGPYHNETKEYDEERQRYLEGLGMKVYRVTNDDVYSGNVEWLFDLIRATPDVPQKHWTKHYGIALF